MNYGQVITSSMGMKKNETTDLIGNKQDCFIYRDNRLRWAGDSGVDEESHRSRKIMDFRGGVHECLKPGNKQTWAIFAISTAYLLVWKKDAIWLILSIICVSFLLF